MVDIFSRVNNGDYPDDPTAEPLYTAWAKMNTNFDYLENNGAPKIVSGALDPYRASEAETIDATNDEKYVTPFNSKALVKSLLGSNVMVAPTKADIAGMVIPDGVIGIRTAMYSLTNREGSAIYIVVDSEPTAPVSAKQQSANGKWLLIAEPILTPEMFGAVADGNATSGTDCSQAFTDALSLNRDVVVGRRSGRYFLKNVPVVNQRLDLGYALIQPASGADCCFQVSGRGRVIGGEFRDSNRYLLKSTTTVTALAVGDVTVTVTNPALFRVGGLVVFVSDELDNVTAFYGGPKRRVHHTTITAISGSDLTLAEAARYPIAIGAPVHTSLGIYDVLDGDGFEIIGATYTTIPLLATVRGSKPLGVSSRGRIMCLQGNTVALGTLMIEGDVSQMDYNFIKSNQDYATQDFRCAFGVKCDATQYDKGPNGGQHFLRVDIVGGQDAFDLRGVQFGGFMDCFADTMAGTGFRFTGNCSRFSIGGSRSWSAFNEKGISIGPSCLDIAIDAIYTDNRPSNVPWGLNIDLEVADGASNIRVNRKSWTGSNLLRADAGWQTVNNITYERSQAFFEDGSATAPSISFRLATGVGMYRTGGGNVGFAHSGLFQGGFGPSGILAKTGSVTDPSIANNGELGTGVYFPSAGKGGFAAGGSFAGGWSSAGMLFKPGTVTAPGLSPNGDDDTGFYSPAANQIAGAVAGARAFLMSSSVTIFDKAVRVPSYLTASLPDAVTAGPGAVIFVSDSSPPTLAMSTGSGWRPVTLGTPF